MPDAPRHVHIVDDVPELTAGGGSTGPVLVVALDGFLDAGSAGRLAVEHMTSRAGRPGPGGRDDAGRVVASFDIDAFFDYRARRPVMLFIEDHYEGYVAPRLVVRVEHDRRGTPYLLLHGMEPDTHWEAFAAGVRAVVRHFKVRLVVSVGSVPMAVPHTRPVMTTNHATRPELLLQENIWRGRIQIPASAVSMLEVRLGEWGVDAMGFVAHVPHYVAQFDYPAAAMKLLEVLEVVTGLEWDLDVLVERGAAREAEIGEQVEDSSEVQELVSGLEQQYDALAGAQGRGAGPSEGGLPLAEERELPTAEELGEEFERFLAGLDPDDE
jgi:predicted ATP-grasp superfamily ATP-dependent carboligase